MTTAPQYRVMTLLGTRPEIIRLSRVIPLFDETFNHTVVHTGQNKGEHLSEIFFRDLDLRSPDIFLEAPTDSLGAFLSKAFESFEKILSNQKPNALIVLGDTNSALLAILAKRLGIPIYHLEAGNRSFDSNVPEETNRKIVDHFSDFNLVYTEHARRNLLAEGVHPRFISKTGSPMREIIEFYQDEISGSEILKNLNLRRGEFFLVSAHRQENVDHPDRLRLLLDTLEEIASSWGLPVIVSTHPRTRQRLDQLGSGQLSPLIVFHEPFGFLDYLSLQKNALCVLSDSGTISEEAAILGFPAVTIRDSMERPEALETGTIIMTGLDKRNVVLAVEKALKHGAPECPSDYVPANFSERVANFMLSTIERYENWTGRLR